jgi:hypothetical protein
LAICLISIPAIAQEEAPFPEPTQNPDATYRIFRTKNIHTLLKLDTRTGQIWQLQWSVEDNERYSAPLNKTILIPPSSADHPIVLRPGRFTLSPTENIYTFVLLDEVNGRTWQVQWGDASHRLVLEID